jgi:phosphatidylglycerol:prolipoprotein diacylglycerol transferase
MKIADTSNDIYSGTTVTVNPCFLYESLWCILGFIILHNYSKRRKFKGEIFLLYVMWYGFGRFFIEGLRTDSLYLGTMRVSQLLAAGSFIAALVLYIVLRNRAKRAVAESGEYVSVYEEAAKAMSEQDDELNARLGAVKTDSDDDEDEDKDYEDDDETSEDKDAGAAPTGSEPEDGDETPGDTDDKDSQVDKEEKPEDK